MKDGSETRRIDPKRYPRSHRNLSDWCLSTPYSLCSNGQFGEIDHRNLVSRHTPKNDGRLQGPTGSRQEFLDAGREEKGAASIQRQAEKRAQGGGRFFEPSRREGGPEEAVGQPPQDKPKQQGGRPAAGAGSTSPAPRRAPRHRQSVSTRPAFAASNGGSSSSSSSPR